MPKLFHHCALLALLPAALAWPPQPALAPRIPLAPPPAAQPATDADARAEALLARMTLEEKVGQMAQITLDVVGRGKSRFASDEPFALDEAKLRDAVVRYKVGSILNAANNRARTPQVWEGIVGRIQQLARKETRLKIPVLYGIDAVHGETYTVGATMFPQQIAQAATRNRALVRRAAEITAYETRASAIPWAFSPVLDLGSDPRSPRHWETYGEDPYLGAELGVQVVKGYQGERNDVSQPVRVAASVKHFLAYQVPSSGKDRTNALVPDESLYEYHLPAFKAAIDAGAHTIMINSGLINGVPVHANYEILTRLLKERLGFKGLVVTDWGDIDNLYKRDRLVPNVKEAIALAINSGIDMGMLAYQYEEFCDNLVALVKEGRVPQARVDDAVRRILRVKFALGLFETPVTRVKDYPKFGSAEHERAAYETAAEAITLLKNQGGLLPLAKSSRVLVTGPNAHSMRTLNGAWTYSWQGEKVEEFAGRYHTILEAVQREIGPANVRYVPGVSYNMKPEGKYYEESADQLEQAVAAARDVDAVLLCVGENSYAEKPGDLNDLTLSPLQLELARRLASTGKPLVLVLNEGRPRIISGLEPLVPAIVQTYLPGNHGGEALADILFGDVNPSGKLPYTYPRYPNALVTYIHKYSEEQKRGQGAYHYEADYNPQWEFGHGLSYTTFAYAGLQLDKSSLAREETLTVTVQVTNTGRREGKEAVHLYTSDLVAAQVAPDVRRLRRFDKVSLQPGETKTLRFTLPVAELAYAGPKGEKILEAGDFEVRVGDQVKRFTLVDSPTAAN